MPRFLLRILAIFGALFPPCARAELESVDVAALGLLKPGRTTIVAPGRDYDLEGYGLMFGLHQGSDEGRFAFARIKGDFDISVRIEDIHNDEKAFTEAGLMVRRSLHPCDLMLGQSVSSNEYAGEADQYTFMRRTKYAGFLYDATPAHYGDNGYGNETFSYNATGYQTHNLRHGRPFPHVWLRLVRTGNTYTSYTKENDAAWHRMGEVALDLGGEPLVGLFVSANHHSATGVVGNPAARAVVRFRDLTGFPAAVASR